MRRALAPVVATAACSLFLIALPVGAQVGPVAPNVRAPSDAEHYAHRSVSALGGFILMREPFRTGGTLESYGFATGVRIVPSDNVVIEPMLAASYGTFTDGGSRDSVVDVTPGVRLGYVRALGDRVALTALGGYRLDISVYRLGGSGWTTAYTHEVSTLLGATIFLSRHFFIEPAIVASLAVHDYGIGFGSGVSTALGATF